MQPIVVFGHWGGPNPWKVRIVLDELNLPYEWKVIEFSEVKCDSYLSINPNGRLPAIQDPNNDITLWESGAIILYLIDQYDPEGKISYPDGLQKHLTVQWLMFQVSGQGPYLGQATWFARFHPEKLPTAIDRFVKEMIRVIGVLDKALEGRDWLVGDKCTFADLSFVTWAEVGKGLLAQLGQGESVQQYSNYARWLRQIETRDLVARAIKMIAEERKAHNLP